MGFSGAPALRDWFRKGAISAQRFALVFWNKTVYICFLVALAMTAASPVPAADASAPSVSSAATTLVVRADPRTGKLVRGPAAQFAKPTASAPKALAKQPAIKPEISAMVEQAARTHDVDPLLVRSVISVESNYDAHAVSRKGAEGLMQLTPPTARMLGVSNTFDPQQNIEAGVRYLKYLQDLYQDDTLALAAYNAGPKAVEKFKSVPPYPETQNYVDQVGRRYEAARKSANQSAAGRNEQSPTAPVVASSQPGSSSGAADAKPDTKPDPKEDQHPKLQQFVDENGRLHLSTSH